MKHIPVILTTLASLSLSSQAKQAIPYEISQPRYHAGEFQVDLYGAYAFAESDSDRLFGEDAFGGGIGFTYYFSRYFGLGGEGMLFDSDGDTPGSAAMNLFLRAPLGDSPVALYAFGGAGYVFNADNLDRGDFRDARDRFYDDEDSDSGDDVVFEAHAGLGSELRFTPNFGIFSDIRYTFVDKDDSDYASARAGIRFNF